MPDVSLHTITIFPLEPADEQRLNDADVELHPSDPENDANVLGFARSMHAYGETTGAMTLLQRVLSRTTDPAHVAQACTMAGAIREQWGEYEPAATCYRQAIAAAPADVETQFSAHNSLAFCLNRAGRHAEAESAARAAIAVDPGGFNAHRNLGIALEAQERPDEAARSYATAARLEPKDPRALRRLRRLMARHPALGTGDRSWLDGVPVDEHAVPEATAREVERLLASIRLGEAVGRGGLQVFGLFWDVAPAGPYRTLDEALAGDGFQVTEVDEQGNVPLLKVVNGSGERVLLVSGEELVGEKQNRVLNASILVDAHVEMPLPVSCVEQGRWDRQSRGFRSAGTSSHAKLRSLMSLQVAGSYKQTGGPHSDQGAVWREVRRKLSWHKARSRSGALREAYAAEAPRLDDVATKITPDPSWCGALFTSGGKVAGLDLFDRPETLTRLWPKLIRSYAIDAFEEKDSAPVSREDAAAWLSGLARPAMESFASPGLGRDIRFECDRVVGAALLVDDLPLHLEVFTHEED